MTVYEKYAIEQDEDYLIGNLANINESIKSKDKHLFLENISNFYQNNIKDYNDKNLKKIQEIKERQNRYKNKENLNINSINANNPNPPNSINDEAFKAPRSFSFESIQNLEVNFDEMGKSFDILSINTKSSTLSSYQHGKTPLNFFINDPILSQNILQARSTLKIFIIGDEKVGKTYFLNKFLKKPPNKDYVHTESLEIFKNIGYLINKSVNLEIYDTNKQILDSPLFKTYLRICDCFIFIFDPTIKSSIIYVENKLAELKKYALSPDILLIGNIRFLDCVDDDKMMIDKNKRFKENDIYVKNIIEAYEERVHYIDLKNLDNFKKTIKKFLIMNFLKKKKTHFPTSSNKTPHPRINTDKSSNSNSNSNKSHFFSSKNLAINLQDNKKSKLDKKEFKSLSFNLSEGDDIND